MKRRLVNLGTAVLLASSLPIVVFAVGFFPPTVETTVPTNVTDTTAQVGGNVTDGGNVTVTVRGVYYSSSNTDPGSSDTVVTSGTGTGVFTVTLSGLTPDTTYHVRAFATNTEGTGTGAVESFTTLSAPAVTTDSATSPTDTTVVASGTVTDDGNDATIEYGFCWNTTGTPTLADDSVSVGSGSTGAYSDTITGLTAATDYYLRAYAQNSVDTAYGVERTFTTTATPPPSNASSDSADCTPGTGSAALWSMMVLAVLMVTRRSATVTARS